MPSRTADRDALAEVMRVLGRAPFDLDAILTTILRAAVRLCRADRGFVYLLDGDEYRHAADEGASPEVVAFNRAHPIRPGRGTLTGRTALERGVVHVPDALADPEYEYREAQRLGGFRAMLGVPMLREGEVIGVIDLWRDAPRPFTAQEIELVRSFADQAAVAVTLTTLHQTIDRQRTELARYVSPQVAALIASDGGEALLAGHRREITVLFCDLRGFTAFSETAAPEDVLGVLRAYHQAIEARVSAAEGTLERYTGDGAMVFFNDPVQQPDHVARAVRTAVGLRDDVGALATGWRRSGFRLGFGAGVATGFATLGRIGAGRRVDYAAIGTVVNLAARLCAVAADGSVLVAGRSHAMVEALVRVRAVPDLSLAGFAQPVPAVDVIAFDAGDDSSA